MKSLSFIRSAAVALLISVLVSICYFFSTAVFSASGIGASFSIRVCLSVAVLLYLFYLLKYAQVSFGKLSVLFMYISAQLIMLYWWPSLLIYCFINVVFIWLVRTIYYHSNMLFSVLDLCACMLSFMVAITALMHSQSMFMCLWSFFLTQAFVLPVLHYLYTRWTKTSNTSSKQMSLTSQRFYQAHNEAEAALRKMA